MFDIGFWELCLIGLVSLLVIGPEKLPKVARITGFWVGKTRHMVASVKEEIKEELKEEELRQLLNEQQAKIDAMTKDLDLQGRVDHFIDATKEQVDKEKHGGE
ncbi:Sec-independent protein translocase protein TatB [Methyloprofundus sp.]|uniref:Sec-independent protein translocase protein TatB n=1 Tax=Methyloprofundus sp. TaxID=2020875 RepID=UPI003D0DF390